MAAKPKKFDPSKVRLTPEDLELIDRIVELPGPRVGGNRRHVEETVKAARWLGYRIAPARRVHWLPRARNRVMRSELIPQFELELEQVFASEPHLDMTVSDVFRGYSVDEERSIVLGVQVASPQGAGSHIVKLGRAEKVQPDWDGWRECILQRNVPVGSILMAVNGHRLSSKRYAVVYQDAYRLFGSDPDTESPKSLEVATDWAIMDSKPSERSVEQVFVQIFSELNRCLYQGATNGKSELQRATGFYRDELRKGGVESAWKRWENGPLYRDLRRDAIWLVTARDWPDAEGLPGYLDPFDYLQWAFEADQIPRTLIGRSHGDLHGRNIVVGVHRGEVEQPAIFDYGEMSDSNLLVWDFVKLECELKSRILPKLFYENGEAAKALALAAPTMRPPALSASAVLTDEEREVAERADRLEIAYQFELMLSGMTRTIRSEASATSPLPDDQRRRTGHPAVDKALCLIHRIRQEAANYLGYGANRPNHWFDEYMFATVVYGVLKARWNVEEPELEWSLISAGVAAAQLDGRRQIDKQRKQPPPKRHKRTQTQGSHLVPLAWAHAFWKEQEYDKACKLLRTAIEEFPCAVTLNVEYALCLAANKRLDEAGPQISNLRRLCRVFRDYETLCRLGRIYKDSGDEQWEADPTRPDFASFTASEHPAKQLYREAFKLYQEAFEFSRHYFPGINAATLALLIGDADNQQELAEKVAKICRERSIDDLEERFWVYATEGEASLLMGESAAAVKFYAAALATPHANNLGMVQTMYDQLCRLYWALGDGPIEPALDLLQAKGVLARLDPGPFGDCGWS